MFHPAFVPGTYRVRRAGGPADESDEEEEEDASVHHRFAPTPFPRERTLGSPGSDDSGPVIPGQDHRCTQLCFLFVTKSF
jgi:hypothetical protein